MLLERKRPESMQDAEVQTSWN